MLSCMESPESTCKLHRKRIKQSKGEETFTGDRKALYRVQVGTYSARYNAEAQAEKLKKAGFDATIVQA